MAKGKKKIIKIFDIIPAEKKSSTRINTTKNDVDIEYDDDLNETKDNENSLEDLEIFRSSEENKEIGYEENIVKKYPKQRASSAKRKKVFIIGLIILGVCVYLCVVKLPKMDVQIMMKKSEVSYDESVTVKTSIGEINALTKQIPGEVISKKINNSFPFDATGSEGTQQKATGKITIYNSYSSAQQILVATTRFETPDGKIYRLVNRVVVPGAKTSGGQIQPSSIEADIIADKVGEEYNVNEVEKLTIPGFKGSEKFEKFYGQITSPVGSHSCKATTDDIAKAQASSEEILKTDLSSLVKLQIPKDVHYVNESEQFTVTSKKVEASNQDGKCNLILEAELKVFVFKEEDIHKFIRTLALNAQAIDEKSEEKEFSIEYGAPKVQPSSGNMNLPLKIRASYWKKINTDDLKKELSGLQEQQVKSIILSKDGIEKISVSFWPFWVSSAPKNLDRISITLE